MADSVTPVGDGVYRVVRDGRAWIVYVAGTADEWWASCEGEVFRSAPAARAATRRSRGAIAVTEITAPMPATVVNVNVAAGDRVRRGDILVVLDAMKMEMPLRADADGEVKAVRCRAGELVQADTVLVELQ